MDWALVLWVLIAAPFALGGLCFLCPSRRWVLRGTAVVVAALAVPAAAAARHVIASGPVYGAGGWLFVDALSAWHLLLLQLVFVSCSIFALFYFAPEIASGHLSLHHARRYGALWLGSLGAMNAVLVSNNLGLMWVGIEATTLLTAFLICTHTTAASLEAMWKYLIMCSVGVAFAFIGTALTAAAAVRGGLAGDETLLWTRLRETAALDPSLIKMGFIFLLIGYGTKTGLAPMHNWLPDAHSQAPAPVSAMLSGFLLNGALYCILRYVPVVESATGHAGWGLGILRLFGVLSLLVGGAFIVFQRDAKRLLAYSSVEHLGIMSLGVGLGGLGAFGAMFHMLNHALSKPLAFFSAGRLGQLAGSNALADLRGMARTSPVWTAGFCGSLLVLLGMAPFAVFMSEFQIVKAAADARALVALVLFLVGVGLVFAGAIRHVIETAWAEPAAERRAVRAHPVEAILVYVPLAALLALGVWMPEGLRHAIETVSAIIRGQP